MLVLMIEPGEAPRRLELNPTAWEKCRRLWVD